MITSPASKIWGKGRARLPALYSLVSRVLMWVTLGDRSSAIWYAVALSRTAVSAAALDISLT